MLLRGGLLVICVVFSGNLLAQHLPNSQFTDPKLIVHPDLPYVRAVYPAITQAGPNRAVIVYAKGSAPYDNYQKNTETIEVADYGTGQILFSHTDNVVYPENFDATPDPDEVLTGLKYPMINVHGNTWVVSWRQEYFWTEEPCGWDGFNISCWPFYRYEVFISVSTDNGMTFSAPIRVSTHYSPYATVKAYDLEIDETRVYLSWTEYLKGEGITTLYSTWRSLFNPEIPQAQTILEKDKGLPPGTHELFGPRLLMDRSRNLLINCWSTHGFGEDYGDLYCKFSDDNAESWSVIAENLNDFDHAASYIEATIDEQGFLHFVWSDRYDFIHTGVYDTDIKYRRVRIENSGGEYHFVGDPAIYINSQAEDGTYKGYSNQYLPKITISRNGQIHVLFYSTVPFDSGYLPRIIYTTSRDQGLTWLMEDEIDIARPFIQKGFALYSAGRSFGLSPMGRGVAIYAVGHNWDEDDRRMQINGIRSRGAINAVRRASGRRSP